MNVTNPDIAHGWAVLLAVALALLPIAMLSLIALALSVGGA